MSFAPEVLQRANARLRQRREQNAAEYARRRERIYSQLPRVRAIDRQLRQTVVQAAAAALRKGVDPAPAIAALREQNLGLQQERAQLLAQLKCPPDYLEEKPVCPQCGDRGWIGSRMCECLKALCSEEQAKQLSSLLDLKGQSFQTFQLDYYGPAYSNERQQMEMVYNVCRRYAREFSHCPIRNLFLTGRPGLGKTFLSACIAREVTAQGFSVVYDTAIHIFSQFESARFGRAPDAEESTRRYLNCDLLILDDLGSEFNTPFVQSCLYQILNSRLVAGRRTIISSNLTVQEIRRMYSAQVASRIEGEFQILEFCGTDIRLQKTRQKRFPKRGE